jgi:hypothetical protein
MARSAKTSGGKWRAWGDSNARPLVPENIFIEDANDRIPNSSHRGFYFLSYCRLVSDAEFGSSLVLANWY